jgi:hypothetical protein
LFSIDVLNEKEIPLIIQKLGENGNENRKKYMLNLGSTLSRYYCFKALGRSEA